MPLLRSTLITHSHLFLYVHMHTCVHVFTYVSTHSNNYTCAHLHIHINTLLFYLHSPFSNLCTSRMVTSLSIGFLSLHPNLSRAFVHLIGCLLFGRGFLRPIGFSLVRTTDRMPPKRGGRPLRHIYTVLSSSMWTLIDPRESHSSLIFKV